jgi:CoA:oxalate CoA-transferase
MSGPLRGIKVVSFEQVLSGPYAAMLLADLGADVIKVEEPGKGDSARYNHPLIGDVSSYFLSVNRGKKSLTVNTKNKKGVDIIKRLLPQTDILIENFRPGVMKRMGLDYEVSKVINPQLIYLSLSGFGQYGPNSHRPVYDMVAQGVGGVVSITGEPNRPGVRVGYSIGDLGAALFAINATLAALYERQHSGRGQHLDISMTDCQVALCENACARYFASGEIAKPVGGRHPILTPFQIFPTKTDNMVIVAHRGKYWNKLCHIIDRPDLVNDPRFEDGTIRTKNHKILETILIESFKTKTRDEWFKIFDEHEMIYGPVNNIEQIITDPHFNERQMFVEVQHPRLGKLKVVGTPMKFSRTPCQIETASPGLGEHTEEILREKLNLTSAEISNLRSETVI